VSLVVTPKVLMRKFSKIIGIPSRLVDFACIVAIDEPLMWQDLFKREDIDKWRKITNEYCALMN
jgi:hypothetical protein